MNVNDFYQLSTDYSVIERVEKFLTSQIDMRTDRNLIDIMGPKGDADRKKHDEEISNLSVEELLERGRVRLDTPKEELELRNQVAMLLNTPTAATFSEACYAAYHFVGVDDELLNPRMVSDNILLCDDVIFIVIKIHKGLTSYYLPVDRLNENDWIEHLRQKPWFNPNIEKQLVNAARIAAEQNPELCEGIDWI